MSMVPCVHEFYQGACVHCSLSADDYRYSPNRDRDAERYQWLRRRTTIGRATVHIWGKGKGRYECWQEEELDSAIDDAMKDAT